MNGVVLLVGGLLLVAVIKLIMDRNWIGLFCMVSSPKDQKQGDSTEKQANPISIHNQLDYRHKQQSAHQEHNAVHSE